MRRKFCTGLNFASKHPTSNPVELVCLKLASEGWIENMFTVGSNFSTPTTSLGVAFIPSQLRQKSSLQMNRKISWDQRPPNMEDYGSDCFEKAGVFQLTPQQALPAEEHVKPKENPKRLKMESGSHVVTASMKTPSQTQSQTAGGDINVSCFFVWS